MSFQEEKIICSPALSHKVQIYHFKPLLAEVHASKQSWKLLRSMIGIGRHTVCSIFGYPTVSMDLPLFSIQKPVPDVG